MSISLFLASLRKSDQPEMDPNQNGVATRSEPAFGASKLKFIQAVNAVKMMNSLQNKAKRRREQIDNSAEQENKTVGFKTCLIGCRFCTVFGSFFYGLCIREGQFVLKQERRVVKTTHSA